MNLPLDRKNKNYITLALLYYEVEKSNKLGRDFKLTKKERVLLVFLGWEQMHNRKVDREKLRKNNFKYKMTQSLIKNGTISHQFAPIGNGRVFYYEVVHQICMFYLKYGQHGLGKTEGSLNVNRNDVAIIIKK